MQADAEFIDSRECMFVTQQMARMERSSVVDANECLQSSRLTNQLRSKQVKSIFRGRWVLTVVFIFIAGIAGCANTGEKSGAYVDDAWITSKVKSEMVADKTVKAHNIGVTTNRGVVTLTGNAETWDELNKATDIARSVKGVTQVENEIHVK